MLFARGSSWWLAGRCTGRQALTMRLHAASRQGRLPSRTSLPHGCCLGQGDCTVQQLRPSVAGAPDSNGSLASRPASLLEMCCSTTLTATMAPFQRPAP